jgi:L-fucose dehydrogenase
MNLGLKNKVIVITGDSRGIGEGVVQVLAGEGAIIAIVGRNQSENLKLQEEMKKTGAVAYAVTAELGEPADCEKSINAIAQKFGRIEGLVNNTCAYDEVGREAGRHERFMEGLHKNLVHYYLMAHYTVPYLKKSKGAIVNINSKTAETAEGNMSAYAAANGGRNALTREWAVELLKYNIRVNAVIVADSNIPGNRMSIPGEIAHAVAFLLSEKSSHTTGQLIHVGGGYRF